MASGRQGGTKPQQQAAEQEFDPKYEWQENATSFILRLHLSGFRKEDFRVQVDGTSRLTVRGQRADGEAKHSRFNKIFQLPATSNLDGINGRFDAGVLTLTIPKKAVDDAKPKPKEDATKAAPPPPPQQEQTKPKEDEPKKPQAERKEAAEMTTAKKAKDDAKPKEDATTASKKPPFVAEDAKPKEFDPKVDAKRGKPEQEQRTPAPPATVRKEEAKAKPTAETEAAAPAAAAEKKQDTPKPPQADGERKAVDPESLAAVTARRHAEEERAKAATAAEEAERQRPRRGLKERVQEELEGLAGSEWAEGLVDTVKKNKEVIAAAVAAFSLGLLASRLFCRN